MAGARQRSTPGWMHVAAPLLLGLFLFIAWQLLAASGTIPATLLPSPGSVARRLATEIGGSSLLPRTWITIKESLLGCVLASSIALPMGYLVGRNRIAEVTLSPYLAASQAIPAIAVAPLLVIWVGYGMIPIVLLCSLLVFFPVVLSTVLGLRIIDTDVIEAAQLDGAHGPSMLHHIEWPLARPSVITGLRNGFTLSITGAVIGEMVMGGQGLGMVMSVQSANNDTAGLFATILVLCLLAVTIYLAMLAIEALTNPLLDRSLPNHRNTSPAIRRNPS